MAKRAEEACSVKRRNDIDAGQQALGPPPLSLRADSVFWSLLGLGVPMIVALLAIFPLLHELGDERFGLLALAWAVTAFSGILDLGIGRAATRLVADSVGRSSWDDVSSIIATSSRLAAAAALAGGALFALAVTADVHLLIAFDRALEQEVSAAALMLAAVFPAQAVLATYRGASEALQRFRAISVIRILLGLASFVGPLVVSQASDYLPALVAPIALSRVVAWVAYRNVLRHQLASTPCAKGRWSNTIALDLLRAGGWLTVSTCLGPVIAQADRFFLASAVSAAAVAAYALPFEVVMQPLVLVGAISTVAFPTLTTMLAGTAASAKAAFRRWLLVVGLLMALVAAAIATVLPKVSLLLPALQLPSEFVSVGQALSLGMWFNALGQMFLTYLHALGRFRAVALLYIFELPIYLFLLVHLIELHGAFGAALAWVIRAAFDTLCLCLLAAAGVRTRVARNAQSGRP